MATRWNRMETWVALIVIALGALISAILGIHTYMVTTATPLHPDPQRVPSLMESTPSREWADAAERARRVIRAGVAEQNVPGLSVAVGMGADIVWAEGFGWANLHSKVPVSPHHGFRIGTASTVLTSAAAGLLIEQGRLNLDEDIQTYVPEFPNKKWRVTVRDVMAHTAGIRSDGGDEGPLFSKNCARPVEGLQPFADRALLFEPGTRYRFSNYGWILVSAAIEAAGHGSFVSFMREQVFKRLAMDNTRADSTIEPLADQVTSYFPRYSADPNYGLDGMREIDLSCYAGSMAFVSTPSDLVRFGLAINGGTLLHPTTVELLQTSQRLRSGEETGYGLGWDAETVTLAGERTRVVGHDGDLLGGKVASLMVFRERGLVVALVSNTSYADTASLALKVAEAFAGHDGAR